MRPWIAVIVMIIASCTGQNKKPQQKKAEDISELGSILEVVTNGTGGAYIISSSGGVWFSNGPTAIQVLSDGVPIEAYSVVPDNIGGAYATGYGDWNSLWHLVGAQASPVINQTGGVDAQ